WLPHRRREGADFEVRTLLSAAQQHALYRTSSLPRKAAILGASLGRRLLQLAAARRCDAVWLHRAAWPLGPAFPERLLAQAGVPIIYEFDDAIYLSDTSEVNRRWRFLKCAGKTGQICRLARHVVVGNPYLAEYARAFNPAVTIIPTTVDTEAYQPTDTHDTAGPLVIGWSGSYTTLPHLRTLDRALQRVAV